MKPPPEPLRWREVVVQPGDPEPEHGPGEALIIIQRYVSALHDPEDPKCLCRACWARAGVDL